MATQTRDTGRRSAEPRKQPNGREELQRSPMMARLLDAIEGGTDVGHYGRLVFVMVARHFLSDSELLSLLERQPGEDEHRAEAMLQQVKERGYNPPGRQRILEWQAQQEFAIIENPHDPLAGNVYRDLRFPDGVYEDIEEFYEERTEAAHEPV